VRERLIGEVGMQRIGWSAAVVTVGDEVVEGRIANANAVWLTERLMSRGIWPRLVVAVPDDLPLIVRQLRIAADSADLVVVSGGLGWTPDDVTRRAVAEAFYRELHVDVERARGIQGEIPWAGDEDISRAASTFPADAAVLESPLGGVPGFVLRNIYVLPGAPAEMRAMFDAIDFQLVTDAIHSESVTCALEEHRVTSLLRQFADEYADVRLGSYPEVGATPPRLTLTLTSRDPAAVRRAAQWVRIRVENLQ
jgi:molybdenum cofactor synthesis domain-containing protein